MLSSDRIDFAIDVGADSRASWGIVQQSKLPDEFAYVSNCHKHLAPSGRDKDFELSFVDDVSHVARIAFHKQVFTRGQINLCDEKTKALQVWIWQFAEQVYGSQKLEYRNCLSHWANLRKE